MIEVVFLHIVFIFPQLTVKGYNDKLVTLLERVVEKMTEFTVDPARLAIFKELVRPFVCLKLCHHLYHKRPKKPKQKSLDKNKTKHFR